jgi:hypothetical protein
MHPTRNVSLAASAVPAGRVRSASIPLTRAGLPVVGNRAFIRSWIAQRARLAGKIAARSDVVAPLHRIAR